MRKRYKDKKCCCKMCKDYKRGWAKRWKARELAKLKRFEKSVQTGQYDNV